ncbi:MAG TPA: hypothetical protein P5234_06745 [Thermoanaerobaculaceae bacterium]|nr:hypothetical protein [Thermoanaerobaculaceae bacterium]HRS15933.1 hypothetical protein [Thermoanaerobaculaceae bacterium]
MERTTALTDDATAEQRPRQEDKPRRRASLLLRCWVEDAGAGAQVLRGWIRNLHTGREQAFHDASLVGNILVQELSDPEAE